MKSFGFTEILILILALFGFTCTSGCSVIKQGVATVKEGFCWVDQQLDPCGDEEPVNDANDPLPGGD